MNGNAIPNVYSFTKKIFKTNNHIKSKFFNGNISFFNACKVKLLFEVRQLKHKKNET